MGEQEEYQPQPYENAGFVQYPEAQSEDRRVPLMASDPGLIMKLLDSEKILEHLENELKGYFWSEKMGKYIKKAEPMMTKKGINWLMTYIRTHYDKFFPLSNYEKDEVNDRMIEVTHTLMNTFCSEYYQFFPQTEHLKKYTQIIRMVDKIEHSIDAVYRRAIGNWERKMFMTTVKESISEMRNPQQQANQQKQGIFQKMNIFGGGDK